MIKIKQPQVGAIKDYHTILPNGLITQNGVSDEVVGTQLIQRFHSFKVSDIIDFDTFDSQTDPETALLLEDGLLPYVSWLQLEGSLILILVLPHNLELSPKLIHETEDMSNLANMETTVYDYALPTDMASLMESMSGEDAEVVIAAFKEYSVEHGAYMFIEPTIGYVYIPAFETCNSAQEALAALDPNSTFTYELETPIIHNLASGGNPYMDFNVVEGGTYEALPTNTPTVETMNADVVFNIDGEDVDGSLGNKTVVTEDEGTWKLKKIFGNTVAWNQKAPLFNVIGGVPRWSIENCNHSVSSDGKQIDITFTERTNIRYRLYAVTINGHKYYCGYIIKISSGLKAVNWVSNSGILLLYGSNSIPENVWTRDAHIVTCNTSDNNMSVSYPDTSISRNGETISIRNQCVIDLTLIYGAGNEPSTPEQFEADYERWFGKPLSYEEYDEGSLRSVQLDAIKTIGFNQWDEEWEVGNINDQGQNTGNEDRFRSKNYIKVLPQNQYCVYYGSHAPNATVLYGFWYDANKGFISKVNLLDQTQIIVAPSNAMYFRFRSGGSPSQSSYNHDICINISDPSKNGTYVPYSTFSLPLTLTTLQGTKSDGTHEVMFPDGLKKAGNVYDEIDYSTGKAIKRVGSRAYASGDSSDNTVMTDGTVTYYALSTPIEYTIDGFIQEPKRIIANTNKLLEGYTELEYLESTGTQYIDTGITNVQTGSVVEVTFQSDNFVGWHTVYGNKNVESNWFAYTLNTATSKNSYIYGTYYDVDYPITTDKHTIRQESNKFYLDGTLAYTAAERTFTNNTNFLLFARMAVRVEYMFHGKIYTAKIWNGGIIVGNLIPARRNSDNVLGMYDTVTGTFLTNAGTGEFIAGPDKNEVKTVYAGQTPVWYAYYGWDYNTSTLTVTRIGNTTWHKELPIQSKMRRCAVKDDGTVKYISSWDYTKYEDGNTVDYAGGDGQIMVEIPEYYYEAYEETVDGVVHKILKLYPYAQIGQKSKKFYCGAFEGITDDASSNTPKLYSISTLTGGTKDSNGNYLAANWTYTSNAADYRGTGGTNDSGIKSNWSRPRTSLSITDFRTRATNRGTGWSQLYFTAYNSILRLYTVEYCNFNSQAAFNSTLTTAGYHQGGLGDGVTNTTSSNWNSFNSYNPFIPCGVTKELGSNTGVIGVTYASGEFASTAYTTYVPSYRGIENPFGHIWKWTDGYTKYGEGSTATVYTCDDITKFSDSVTNQNVPDGYSMKGTHTIGEGNFGDWYWNSDGTFVHKTFGTGPFLDYAYHNNTGTRALRSGGSAHASAAAGLFSWSASYAPSNVNAYFGGRLYYTPSEN